VRLPLFVFPSGLFSRPLPEYEERIYFTLDSCLIVERWRNDSTPRFILRRRGGVRGNGVKEGRSYVSSDGFFAFMCFNFTSIW
jgi:hypothetical protein